MADVGALQGYRGDEALGIYRHLTPGLHGLRPRDLLLAAFRALCSGLGTTRILAVGDRHRVCDSGYFRFDRNLDRSCDAAWAEHHGACRPDGFFELPVVVERRSREAIPTPERAEYRRRYEMLARLGADIACGVHGGGAS